LPATVDASVYEWETVLVSAGRRGLQIELAPSDLIALIGAKVGELTKN
jgi:Cys-tRNA(Pro)/Cys-tRNA(Cys) deacylase